MRGEINAHIAEKAELETKVKELEAENARLKSNRAELAMQMTWQEPWRMGRQLEMSVRSEIPADDGLVSVLHQALLKACPDEHYGNCLLARRLTITGLEQIRNVRLWKSYDFRREEVRKELDGKPILPVTSGFVSCTWAQLNSTVNEILVLHGTKSENVDLIANFGFDERLSREKGLYGQGIYFTDQTCKAFQYSGAASHSEGCFIITRLVLGDPHYAQGPLVNTRVEPLRDPNDASRGRFHSVLASSGTPHGGGSKQVHREFVIFNGAQAYPELIVRFRF